MRHWLMVALMAVLIVGLGAGTVLAAPAPEQAGDDYNPVGKPSPMEVSALVDLGIWTLLVFFLLLIVLGKFAWKPILQGLQTREKTIQDARDEALKASEEAKRYRDELQAELKKANEEAARIIAESRKVAQEQADEKRKAAEEETTRMRERAKREIEAAKDQALQEIWSQTANLAAAVSSKAIRRELGTEDHRRLVDEALAEIQSAVKSGSASA